MVTKVTFEFCWNEKRLGKKNYCDCTQFAHIKPTWNDDGDDGDSDDEVNPSSIDGEGVLTTSETS
jgi:hypothetical protein